MRAHKEIRLQTLALVAAVTGVIGVLMFSLLTRGGSLVPRPSLLAGADCCRYWWPSNGTPWL